VFTVGQRFTVAFNHGIFITESTGYQVQGNTFVGTSSTPDNDPIGVECRNTGDAYNRIFGNDFSNLYAGIVAEGDNRDNSSPTVNGLEFLCNKNSLNTYDHLVEIDDDEDPLLSGVRDFQGDVGDPAGNTFSLNTTPNGSDFFNGSDWLIRYHFGNGTNEEPMNVFEVTLADQSKASSCGNPTSRLAIPFDEATLNSYQAEYATALSNYESLQTAY
jgi:hypothetical protein